MNPKPDPLLLLLILSTLISICISQIDPQHQTCNQTFLQCGDIREIGYPFWGHNRPASCGYPGFELNCQNNILRLNISSITYRVLSINNRTQTLRVARDDLWDNICPRYIFDTALNFTIFDYSSTANDQNITLRYGCTLNQIPTIIPPYYFTCNVNDTNSWNLYLTRQTSYLGDGIRCDSSISVPVNQTAAQILAVPTASTDLLQVALRNGFSIQWSAKNDNCNLCVRSGGVCGYNQNSGSFSCYCSDRTHEFTCDDNRNGNGT